MKTGFNNKKYLKLQSENIKKRIKEFDKLYIEFGGKLLDDYHAVRCLPGFEYDSKLKMLKELKEDLEIIICISANDIERHKVRADYGITYDIEVLRLINQIRNYNLTINSVVITLYDGQKSVDAFIRKLGEKNIKTYIHTPTKGYPTDINTIVSDEGYGANPYIETTKKIVVVTAPGPCSGKLATCLSQLYHEYKNNVNAGYAKFETFPVWNLPLNHPVNKAYEAATADLRDKNMIDYFHLEKYNVMSVNYNRDLEVFPVLKNILSKITGRDIYFSPTDMGVNSIGYCITNDEVVCEASKQEIIRRYYNALCDFKKGLVPSDTPERIKLLMNELSIDETDRKVVNYALKKKETSKKHSMSIKLPNGKIVTGRETDLLSPASSLILNAIKSLTNIPDDVYLISPSILEPILKYKSASIQKYNYSLDLNEVLIALNICSVTNPIISRALENLKKLNNCEAHSTYILEGTDLKVLKSLRINVTSEPQFYFEELY